MPITKATASSIAPAAKGDLVVGSATNDASVLAVGSADQVLTVDSSTATGLKWATPAGGGKVLQVVQQLYTTSTSSSSTTFADSGITLSITPSSSSSKVLVIVTIGGCLKSAGNANSALNFRTLRGSTTLIDSGEIGYNNASQDVAIGSYAVSYLDSPNTTSATTYKVQLKNSVSASSVSFNNGGSGSTITLMEIGA
jgi:hypothetical protein